MATNDHLTLRRIKDHIVITGRTSRQRGSNRVPRPGIGVPNRWAHTITLIERPERKSRQGALQTIPIPRGDLALRLVTALLVVNNWNAVLALRGKVAWAHDWISDPSLMPVFQALPGASLIVNGAMPAKNSALTSAGAELRLISGLSLLAKFDGEFAAHSQIYAGTGTVRYMW